MAFLILFPLVPAFILALLRPQALRAWVVRMGAAAWALAAGVLAWRFAGQAAVYFEPGFAWLDKALFAGELVLAVLLGYVCRRIRPSEAWIPLLVVLQTLVLVAAECGPGMPGVPKAFCVDPFSILMAVIVAIVGGLICVYALPYMAGHHGSHPHHPDHRRSFFFVLFLFLSAMFGLIFSNHLGLLFFFWEVTTLCSFLLIGYDGREDSLRKAYRALGLNLLGGLAFAASLFYLALVPKTLALDQVVALGKTGALVGVLPAALLAFAGLTKSAQLPFSSWLLGAMVAPTPVSALLHSSTMVKAGVFLILKLAPVFEANPRVGLGLALVGGVTFLSASLAAVTQSQAKRVLAYSTIANLGLVVACAGVGSPQAVWAGMMLILFHALAKGLLFLAVGAFSHRSGSLDIEDMEGLLVSRPWLGLAFLVGILGMFLAPFGMLISKWACFQAFTQASPILALLLAFGSAPTLFFWAKWMGKLVSRPPLAKLAEHGAWDEMASLGLLAGFTLAACLFFPLVSRFLVLPSLPALVAPLDHQNTVMMVLMLVFLLGLPLAFFFYRKPERKVPPYLGGANQPGKGESFRGALGRVLAVETRNDYLASFFSEAWLAKAGAWACAACLAWMAWAALTPPAMPGLILAPDAGLPAPAGGFWAWGPLAFILGAPLLGGLVAGLDRVLTARLQSRVGPPVLQPFYDVLKLFSKRTVVVNHMQVYYAACFLVFMLLTGGLFLAGGDLLLVVFAFSVAALFLVLAGYAPHSPYSKIGADRELLQMMAYEPVLLLMALGMYEAARTFRVGGLATGGTPLIAFLPGVFLSFVFVLSIKLRKSPFDLSTSHHGHQELVKGLTTEYSGTTLALIEMGHWCENALLLGMVYLFFAAWSPWLAATATAAVYVAEVLVDNAFARLRWGAMIKSSWGLAGGLAAANVVALYYFR